MNRLASYVSAIHQLSSPVSIVSRTTDSDSWLDQGFTVSKELTTYHFDNGVVIRRSVEQDSFPSTLSCAECWISYEVLANGDLPLPLSPARQAFENTCRESFWLAYHRD